MRKYIFKRLIYMVIALFCIITLTFFLMRIAPGNPFASEKALPANIQAQLNKQYGLSNPWYIQFRDYLVGILKFDFGYSMKYRGRSTNDIIFSSFPVSLALGMQALVIAVGLGTTLGVISATYHNKVRDYAATVVAVLGISVLPLSWQGSSNTSSPYNWAGSQCLVGKDSTTPFCHPWLSA